MTTAATEPSSLRSLATRGAISLIGRQAVAFLASTISGILLAQLLSPADFGAYAYLLFAQGLARVIVDGGLTATLIRQPYEPSERQWGAVFGFQLGMAVVLGAMVAAAALVIPSFAEVPGFLVANGWAAVAIVLAPVLSISFARLERSLRFDRVGLLSLVQPVVFSVLAPCLAVLGLGVVSLGVSMFVSNAVALLVALPFTGAPPRPAFVPVELRERIRFGGPFIASGLVSTVKDAVNPLLVGLVVGAAAVGYIRWSQQVAALGIYLLGAATPMLFALFARVVDEPDRLGRAVSLALFWANAITAPLALLLTVFILPITIGLYGEKWVPAIPLYFLLALTNVISPTTTVLLALCNSVGRPGVPLLFSMLWFTGTWLLTGLLVASQGAMGYAIANALVQVIGIALIVVARRFVRFRFVRSIALPWSLAVAACLPAAVAGAVWPPPNVVVVAAYGFGSLILFVLLTRLCAPHEFHDIRSTLRRSDRGQRATAAEQR